MSSTHRGPRLDNPYGELLPEVVESKIKYQLKLSGSAKSLKYKRNEASKQSRTNASRFKKGPRSTPRVQYFERNGGYGRSIKPNVSLDLN